ncbi:MAG: DUF4126 domain-containing protein [Caldilineales bacterium]|nr:DUF4126 domain-containing protein [Caldilineales bacterium]MCW5860849.1 DUF4126 domain-containing protein [Caldilineales bacterium]
MNIFSAFGLASAAGLNAYLPLLIVGLLSRYTDLLNLAAPWDTLENPWVLAVLAVLLLIEMTVDKIPAVDSLNDGIQTFVRPAAGAILFAASGSIVTDLSPVLAMIAGILVAGGVHGVKAAARPVVTATTAGLGNPVVSVVEDVASATITVLSILVPALAALTLALLLFLVLRRIRRRSTADRP